MATKKKKKHQFPTAYTVIIIVLLLVQLLTFVIPAGNYATITYDTSNKDFVVTRPSGKRYKEPATQATLKKYKVNIAVKKFKDGTIYKPVAIPNSYERINLKKSNLW
ncbi:MAG: YfcC family protein, partial [Lactobacillus crispatus]|nr:YfcC family protein [Lactobacillus crispatus]MCT7699916.1 YfcC family protein [Lactobacillus crispatus]